MQAAARVRWSGLLGSPHYREMFRAAGFPEAREGIFSDGMAAAVVVGGDEDAVARRLRAYLEAGMDEVIASVVTVGDDHRASLERTLALVATL